MGFTLANAVWPKDRQSQRGVAEHFLTLSPTRETVAKLLARGLDELELLLACLRRATPGRTIALLLREAPGLRWRLDGGVSGDSEGTPPLQLAADHSSADVTRLLLRHGADPRNASGGDAERANRGATGMTPLWIAADFARIRSARMHIACGADVEAVKFRPARFRPAHIAAQLWHRPGVEELGRAAKNASRPLQVFGASMW